MHERVGAAGLGLVAMLGGACAFGADPEPTTTFNPTNVTNPGSGDDLVGSDDATTRPPGEEEGDEEVVDDTTGMGGDSTGMVEGSTSASMEDSTTDPSEGGGDCVNMDTCPGALLIGGVSGDSGSMSIDTSGAEPTWLTFQVSEDDDSVQGAGMSFSVLLDSPMGADFDLYVYRGVEGGSSGCGGFMQSSTNPGSSDMVSMSWGEGAVANGNDDSVWVAVEIVAKDDVCAPPQEWSLLVSGNI